MWEGLLRDWWTLDPSNVDDGWVCVVLRWFSGQGPSSISLSLAQALSFAPAFPFYSIFSLNWIFHSLYFGCPFGSCLSPIISPPTHSSLSLSPSVSAEGCVWSCSPARLSILSCQWSVSCSICWWSIDMMHANRHIRGVFRACPGGMSSCHSHTWNSLHRDLV